MNKHKRTIKSFVRRQGRLTPSQKKVMNSLSDISVILNQENIGHFCRECNKPLILDVGFGMGDSLISLARHFPDFTILGVEVFPPGVASAISQIQQHELSNVYIVNSDFIELVTMFELNSIHGIQLLFPDPWPKKRHHKRRLVQVDLINQLSRCLDDKGWLHIVTDHDGYRDHIAACIDATDMKRMELAGQYHTYYQTKVTKYQRRAMRLNHSIESFFLRKAICPSDVG